MGYVLCSIDIGHAFLPVAQKDLTETVCVDAASASTTYVLGRVSTGDSGMALRCGMSLLADSCRPS